MYFTDQKSYIKVSAIYRKLRQAENLNKTIYISGAVGYGKTSAVEYFYRKKAHLVLSGENGHLEEMPAPEEIRQSVVVIDDISWITDVQSQQYIINLIKYRQQSRLHIILIGRSRLPRWLRVIAVGEAFIHADEHDLMLNEKEVANFLESRGITASQEELEQIIEHVYGNPLALMYLSGHLSEKTRSSTVNPTIKEGTCGYDKAVAEAVRMDCFYYYDYACYEKWDREMREVLLAVCQYETFTIKMTEMITGNNRVPMLFEEAMAVGDFLTKLDQDIYSYRIQLRNYFKWKQAIIYTAEQQRSNYEQAALYFEMENQIEQALKYYQAAGNEESVSELLIKNATKHPGTAHFFETREYYLKLPEKKIKESPVLISGMSMLHGIMFQPDKSEYWYQELLEYEKNAVRGSSERWEASVRIAYLNIALPHRGIHGVINILKNTAVLCANKKVKLPEFSVTSNLPSLMNGGLDFCEWSRNDRELGVVMKKPVEIVLGKYGVGLVDIALAESGMENGTMESYEIMTRLNNGYLMSDTGGKIEMCFAATGLMIREHLAKGQPEIAENLFASFYKKVVSEKASQLLPNMTTLHMWMRLMHGDTAEAKKWLAQAPDDMHAFCILDRYHHINKIRCLTILSRYDEALALVERLNLYFTQYERHYLWIENQILKSILQYRKGVKEWNETLKGALKKAERYHFIRIFSREGNALKPLLDRLKETTVKQSYLEEICQETNQIALYYPNYLKEESVLTDPLTDTEKRILKLLCSGVTSKEICTLCDFSYSAFKFHIHNIYKKLDVGNRADAEREAKRLKLDK